MEEIHRRFKILFRFVCSNLTNPMWILCQMRPWYRLYLWRLDNAKLYEELCIGRTRQWVNSHPTQKKRHTIVGKREGNTRTTSVRRNDRAASRLTFRLNAISSCTQSIYQVQTRSNRRWNRCFSYVQKISTWRNILVPLSKRIDTTIYEIAFFRVWIRSARKRIEVS